jgi:hypothetical protein
MTAPGKALLSCTFPVRRISRARQRLAPAWASSCGLLHLRRNGANRDARGLVLSLSDHCVFSAALRSRRVGLFLLGRNREDATHRGSSYVEAAIQTAEQEIVEFPPRCSRKHLLELFPVSTLHAGTINILVRQYPSQSSRNGQELPRGFLAKMRVLSGAGARVATSHLLLSPADPSSQFSVSKITEVCLMVPDVAVTVTV